MESLMDSVMEKVAGREWHYEALSLPQVGHLPISEIAEPITIEQFHQAACRRCDHVKSTTILFDVHFKVSEFGGLARVGELIQQGELDHLPLPLCLSGKLPPSAKMGAVIQNLEDGTMNVGRFSTSQIRSLSPTSPSCAQETLMFPSSVKARLVA